MCFFLFISMFNITLIKLDVGDNNICSDWSDQKYNVLILEFPENELQQTGWILNEYEYMKHIFWTAYERSNRRKILAVST